MRARLNILTGKMEAPRARPAPQAAPAQPDPLVNVMMETLEYLKREPIDRAKKEAEPIIAAEREKFAQDLSAEQQARATAEAARLAAEADTARIHAEAVALLREQQDGAQRLRDLIAATEEDAARVRATLEAKDAEVAKLNAQVADAERRHREALNRAPADAPAPLNPADIRFEYFRHDNGLLKHVVLRAKNHADVIVDIDRNADNRMRNLKVRTIT